MRYVEEIATEGGVQLRFHLLLANYALFLWILGLRSEGLLLRRGRIVEQAGQKIIAILIALAVKVEVLSLHPLTKMIITRK